MGCTVKVCNSIQRHADLCKLIIQHEWKFIYLKLQLTRNRDRICQQPGLMATLSRDWRDIYMVTKDCMCEEECDCIQSLPHLLEMVDPDNPGMNYII